MPTSKTKTAKQAGKAMNTKKVVPLFSTDKLAETRDFYTRHLGFRPYFENPNYVGLRCASNSEAEICFMDPPPEMGVHARGDGLYYCLQVESVDAEHERLVAAGVEIRDTPADMPWGDRRLIVTDPNGIFVYLHEPIEPQAEYRQYFLD